MLEGHCQVGTDAGAWDGAEVGGSTGTGDAFGDVVQETSNKDTMISKAKLKNKTLFTLKPPYLVQSFSDKSMFAAGLLHFSLP
jgi:hypothetical protein